MCLLTCDVPTPTRTYLSAKLHHALAAHVLASVCTRRADCHALKYYFHATWLSARRLQVVTKRTKNLKKQEIPSLDDPISKLNHIGKETVKKLNELKAAADESNVDLPIPSTLWRCDTL